MTPEPVTSYVLRRNLAIVLAAAVGYLIVTDWITDLWAACAAFTMVFAAAAIIAVRGLYGKFELWNSWLLIPLGAAAAWGGGQLAAGVPQYRFETWWQMLTWGAALALFWSCLQAFSPARVSAGVRLSLVLFGSLLSLEAVLQLFAGDARIYGLVSLGDVLPMGPFQNRDHYCALIELILPLALWTGIRNRRLAWAYYTAAGIMYASVIASASRAGGVIATVEVLVLVALGIRRKRSGETAYGVRLVIAIGVVVAIAGFVVGWSPLLDRFQLDDVYRRKFLESTLHMIRERPWFGFGLGSWPWVYPRYALIDAQAFVNHAHNDWAEWAADGGIPFAALLGTVAARTFWLAGELPWGIGAVAVFAHALVDFPFARPPVLLAVVLLVALMEVEHIRAAHGYRPEVLGMKERLAHLNS